MIVKYVKNLRKIEKFYLRVIIFRIMHDCMDYIVKGLFWVPACLKDTFFVGMNTTQQSESMHAFFDGYVYTQTTLKEFVDQFVSTLRRMVENEARADFDSFNCMISCISHFYFEKQFQDVYTNAKFKEVREEFGKVMSCNNYHLKVKVRFQPMK